jgi:p21-activated kinase 1
MESYSQNTTNGTSQRRKLTKRPPPSYHQHASSLSIDGRIDTQSLQSKRSSTSLRRAPSAPSVRTPTTNASNNSSPRHPPSAHRTNPSPLLPAGEFAAQNQLPPPASAPQTSLPPSTSRSSQPRPSIGASTSNLPSTAGGAPRKDQATDPHIHQPLSSKTSEEFIGAPFDGSAILDRIAATKSPIPGQRPQQALLSDSSPAAQAAAASLNPQSQRYPAGSDVQGINTMSEKSKGTNAAGDNAVASLPKRDSDETREKVIGPVLRKKSGFSGFVSGLVGTPKKPIISAPENPVHVTHVGYDSNTGQFTVGSVLNMSQVYFEVERRIADPNGDTGTAQRMAAINQRERDSRERPAGEPRSTG